MWNRLLWSIRAGDTATLLSLLGVLVAGMIAVALIINIRAARRLKQAPPPEWGRNSARYRR